MARPLSNLKCVNSKKKLTHNSRDTKYENFADAVEERELLGNAEDDHDHFKTSL